MISVIAWKNKQWACSGFSSLFQRYSLAYSFYVSSTAQRLANVNLVGPGPGEIPGWVPSPLEGPRAHHLCPPLQCSHWAPLRRNCRPAWAPSCHLHPTFTPAFRMLEQGSKDCHPRLLISGLKGLMDTRGRVISDGFEARSAMLCRCWHPGPFPRCFRPHSPTCLRAENKVAKEIKAWCGETKHEAYWLFKNILNNIL